MLGMYICCLMLDAKYTICDFDFDFDFDFGSFLRGGVR